MSTSMGPFRRFNQFNPFTPRNSGAYGTNTAPFLQDNYTPPPADQFPSYAAPNGLSVSDPSEAANLPANRAVMLRSSINEQRNNEAKTLQAVAEKQGEKSMKDLQASVKKLAGPGAGGAT